MALSSTDMLSLPRTSIESLCTGTEHRLHASFEKSRQPTIFCAQANVYQHYRNPFKTRSDCIVKKALGRSHPASSALRRKKCTFLRRDAVLLPSGSICATLGADYEGPAEAGLASTGTVLVGGHDGMKLEISRLINGMWQVSG